MNSQVTSTAPAADMAPIIPVAPAAQTPIQVPPPADEPDVRLIIEEAGHAGTYVYKTLDRRTGEVLQQFPREQLLKLQDDEDYRAGSVINARA